MTDATAILIAAIPPTITSLGALILGYINRRKIEGVAHAMNHLLDVRVNAAKAEGAQIERDKAT